MASLQDSQHGQRRLQREAQPLDNRIAILGGTFDPPHLGHLALARGVADALGVERVMLVPTGNPHFKQDSEVTPAEDRLAMTWLLADEDPRLTVSAIEARRSGVTYTVDTLRELHERYPGAQLLFIVGGDCLEHIWRWHAAEELAQLCTVVAVARNGYDFSAGQQQLAQCGIDFDVRYFEFDVPQISSSEVRRRVATGMTLGDCVPAAVGSYIAQHRLYTGRS